jgi:uncharacterized delta-60 repeat protein
VIRLTSAGALDATFGAAGVVQTDLPLSNTDVFTDLLLQPDGKIVCGGFNDGGLPDVAVARYLPDGSLDAGFDTDGIRTFSFGAGFGGAEFGRALALQPDGNVLLAGFGDDGATANPDDALVARLQGVDGSLDATFGVGGRLVLDPFLADEEIRGMAFDPEEGHVYLAGHVGGGASGLDILLIRLE